MLKRSTFTSMLILLALLAAPASARTTASLDRSFGIQGKVLTGFGERPFFGSYKPIAIAVEPDGRVVLGVQAPSQSFTLMMFNPDGTPDSGFGDHGVVTTAIDGAAMAVESDGKIVVAGSTGEGNQGNPDSDIAVVRYLPNGDLDRSFGRLGLVRLRSNSRDEASDVAIQPDGMIVVTGTFSRCEGRCLYERHVGDVVLEGGGVVLARFSPRGKLLGKPTSATGSEVLGLAVGAQGQLAALTLWAEEESDEGLAQVLDRYKANGALLGSFGSREGQLTLSTTENSAGIPRSLAFQTDGKIVLGGFTAGSGGVARLNADGSVDTSFGVNGAATCAEAKPGGSAPGVSVLPDGRLLVAGESPCGIDRYLASGTPDPSFGENGRVDPEPQLGAAPDALAPGPDGTVLVAAWNQATRELRLARYREDGSPDPSFGAGGVVSVNPVNAAQDAATAIVRQPDGKLLAAGTTDSKVELALARYLPNGHLDPSFGQNGEVTKALDESPTRVTPVILQPDGKIVVGDLSHLARFLPDGRLDPSFGTAGVAVTAERGQTQALALAANGDIYAADLGPQGEGSGSAAVRYLPDGKPDSSFGSGGIEKIRNGAASEDVARAIAVQPDGKVLVAGDVTGGFGLVRLMPDGRLDPSFDGDGTVHTHFYRAVRKGHRRLVEHLKARLRAMVLAPNGEIVVGGLAGLGKSLRRNGFIARYQTNGTQDRRFGKQGFVRVDRLAVNALAIDRCGRIDLAGGSVSGPVREDFGVSQLSPTGNMLRGPHRSPRRVALGNWDEDHASGLAVTPRGFVAAGVAPAIGQNDQFALASFRSICGRSG